MNRTTNRTEPEAPQMPGLIYQGVMMDVLHTYTVTDEASPAFGTTINIRVTEGQAELAAAFEAAVARFQAAALRWVPCGNGMEMAI